MNRIEGRYVRISIHHSGGRRYVVLEVAGRRPPDTYLVVSGFGERAQWFRNIRADPRVRVYALSRKPTAATARVLPREEATDALAAYSARHPRAWAAMEPVLGTPSAARTATSNPGCP